MTLLREAWEVIGAKPPHELGSTRDTLHCALQAIARLPEVLVPPEDGFGHAAFDWDGAQRAFVSRVIAARAPYRVALRVPDAMVLTIGAAGAPVGHFALHGRSPDDLAAWLAGETERLGPRAVAVADDAAWPPDACVPGARFDCSDYAALQELPRYYMDAFRLLEDVRGRWIDRATPSPVRVWPHGFDMDTVLALGERDGEARQVGVGMSPGHGDEPPYFYVNAWPARDPAALPPMDESRGAWSTDRWFGAALPARQVLDHGDADAQALTVTQFVDFAADALYRLETEAGDGGNDGARG